MVNCLLLIVILLSRVGELPIDGIVQDIISLQESLLRSVASDLQDLDSLVHVADTDLVHRLEHLVGPGVIGDLLHHGGQGDGHESQLFNQSRVESVNAQVVAAETTSITESGKVVVVVVVVVVEVKSGKVVVRAREVVVVEVHGGDV